MTQILPRTLALVVTITLVRPGRPDQQMTARRGPDSAGRLAERIPQPARQRFPATASRQRR
jgi:hypothetical protein